MFWPTPGYISDPQLSTHNLQRAAEAKGSEFRFGREVVEIRTRDGRICGVKLDDGTEIGSPVVINVAGPHSAVVNAMAGALDDITIETKPLRQEVVHVPAPAGFDFESLGTVVSDSDIGCHIRPESGNHILIGSEDPECDPREFERFSTACANAYVGPLIERNLDRFDASLRERGFRCPLLLMLSSGGLTTVETAKRFPVRLMESGPAGGAIFAGAIARSNRLDKAMSFDMGGTTAKICLVDDGSAQTSRRFEVARVYRFRKDSGIPLRIPVIDMVEIGVGGGSIAWIDELGRLSVGPESAGAQPGPACYSFGGREATVTDANVVMGRIAPEHFAGGKVSLDPTRAENALSNGVGEAMALSLDAAAFGVTEVVCENMASAARVHAIESGKNADDRTLIAFGGAAPLHACQLADKLGIRRIVVPRDAGGGDGSAPAPEERPIFDPASQSVLPFRVLRRDSLAPGHRVDGPAIVTEDETATVVASRFDARTLAGGAIELRSRSGRPQD